MSATTMPLVDPLWSRSAWRSDIVRYQLEVVIVADVLIRDVPDGVLAGVDARAARLGLSRAEYIRRRLAADAAVSGEEVSSESLRALADSFADLADPDVMGAAWR